jgi:hypothetical protein
MCRFEAMQIVLAKEKAMSDCKFVTKAMLPDRVEVRTEDRGGLTFYDAKAIADRRAEELTEDPVLLSWWDKKRGMFAPDVVCCDTEKPTWLIYAESRGGRISVDINDEDYVFVYREGLSEF